MPKGTPNNPQNPEKPTEKPTIKAFTVNRRSGGWCMSTYHIKNGVVIKIEHTEPDLRILAIEAFKIASFKWWTSQ